MCQWNLVPKEVNFISSQEEREQPLPDYGCIAGRTTAVPADKGVPEEECFRRTVIDGVVITLCGLGVAASMALLHWAGPTQPAGFLCTVRSRVMHTVAHRTLLRVTFSITFIAPLLSNTCISQSSRRSLRSMQG